MLNQDQYSEPLRELQNLQRFLQDYQYKLQNEDLRSKVLSLLPAIGMLRKLGQSLVPEHDSMSARDRILKYFRLYPMTVISGDEIFLVSGIQEYARRIRELRRDFGWHIMSGVTTLEYGSVEYGSAIENIVGTMSPSDYILTTDIQNKESAYLNNVALDLRKRQSGGKQKILDFLLSNVGKAVSGETLRYIANDSKEWARRVRELRTEDGWDIRTKHNGSPDLPVGMYVLVSDVQSDVVKRDVPKVLRNKVVRRDNQTCTTCGWNKRNSARGDFRFLEVHHEVPLHQGGSNDIDNLTTLCNRCHDRIHKHDYT